MGSGVRASVAGVTAFSALSVMLIGGISALSSGANVGASVDSPAPVSAAAKTKQWMIPAVRSVKVDTSGASIYLRVTVDASKKLGNAPYAYIEVRGGGDRCLITRLALSSACTLILEADTVSVSVRARASIEGQWKRWSRNRVVQLGSLEDGSGPNPPSGGEDSLTVLAMLPVSAEVRYGYDRSLFRHWVDADADGCDTRAEVLRQESTSPVQITTGCRITSGRWVSAFDGAQTVDPSTFDVDHVVPLAEAWDSGARDWDVTTRQAFANDLGFAGSLIAVSASSNRSKGDRDPAEWLPPDTSYRCTYVTTWIAVKYRWSLSIDPVEKASMKRDLNGCGNPSLSLPEKVPIRTA